MNNPACSEQLSPSFSQRFPRLGCLCVMVLIALLLQAVQAALPTPIISYATYLGTDLTAQIALTVDKEGNTYVARNHGYAATPGAYQSGTAISVTKFNKTGTSVIYTVTFGDGELDRVNAMAVDDSGNLYLVGQTNSSTFPTTPGAFQTSFGLTGTAFLNAFVMKLNPQGTALVYSTFLKGDTTFKSEKKGSVGRSITIDAQGNAYIVGHTNALDFPISTGAVQSTLATYGNTPPVDVFVTKLNPQGSGIVYSTYLGSGSNTESGTGIAVDAQGNAYITGYTGDGWVGITQPQGKKFPTTTSAYKLQDTYGLGNFLPTYAFVSKLNSTGTALAYSALIGTVAGNLVVPSLALDAANCAYVAGWTKSQTFPTTTGAFKTRLDADYGNAFVTKLNAAGSALDYSTLLGGTTGDYATSLSVDAAGQAQRRKHRQQRNAPHHRVAGTSIDDAASPIRSGPDRAGRTAERLPGRRSPPPSRVRPRSAGVDGRKRRRIRAHGAADGGFGPR